MAHEEFIRVVPGSKYTVLMIHGIVGTPKHFDFLMPLIPETWSVYNLLLDGHGQGVAEFGKTSMKKWQAQVASRLAQIRTHSEKVILVAHSMGTLFAISEAIRQPDAIAGILLLNVPLYPVATPAAISAAFRLALGKVRDKDTVAQHMGADSGVALTPKLWKYLSWVPRFAELLQQCRRTRKLLPQLAIPAQAFQSRHDVLVSPRSNHPLQRHPAICCTVLPDSDHFIYAPKDAQLLREVFIQLLRCAEETAER